MRRFFKKWRYQLMDRRMKVPVIYFILLVLALPVLWVALVSGALNFTTLFALAGFVFLALFLYVQVGQRIFGTKN